MSELLDILGQAGRSARDIAAIKLGILRQNAAQNAAPMARGVEEGLIGEGGDMAQAGAGALGDAYGAGDGALDALLAGYHDRMAKARARAAALRAQSPEAFAYGEKLPDRVADAAGVLGAAGHLRLPELPRIGPGTAPELAFARAGGEAAPPMAMPPAARAPISRAGEPLEFDQRAFHGTHAPNMEKFDLNKVGTGEGAQAFGWGGYFAKAPALGDKYRVNVTRQHGLTREPELLSYDGKTMRDINNETMRMAYEVEKEFRHDANLAAAKERALSNLDAELEELKYELPRARTDREREILQSNIGTLQRRRQLLGSMDLSKFKVQEGYNGTLYKMDIPENHELLDYDNPLFMQSDGVVSSLEASGIIPKSTRKWIDLKKAISRLDDSLSNDSFAESEKLREELARLPSDGLSYTSSGEPIYGTSSGSSLYDVLSKRNGPRAASEALRAAGIPGLRYLDAASRGAGNGSGSHNFVIWDEARIGKPEPTTLERELQLMAGGE